MPGNRKQRERVALALTHRTGLEAATPALIEAVMTAGDWEEVLGVLCGVLHGTAPEEALPAVCKAAGIVFQP